MTSYAVAHLRDVKMGPDIVAYLKAIDATLTPFRGRFIIHGGEKEELEGSFPEDLIVIAFPDREAARAWYGSPAYQAILPKRTGNSQGNVFLIDGVDEDHRATDILLPHGQPASQSKWFVLTQRARCFPFKSWPTRVARLPRFLPMRRPMKAPGQLPTPHGSRTSPVLKANCFGGRSCRLLTKQSLSPACKFPSTNRCRWPDRLSSIFRPTVKYG
jgi:uncharacterized protein (DUF1330 family)